MLRSAREHWRSARGLPLLRNVVESVDRVWWSRTIRKADLVDLDYVAAQLGRRVSERAAVRWYVRGGFRSGFGLNPLFLEQIVSQQLSDADRVPALYAYLVNDQRRIRVAPFWDAPRYLMTNPEALHAPGSAVGHAWRSAKGGESLAIGPGDDAEEFSWTTISGAARRALEAPARPPSHLSGTVYVFLLGAREDITPVLTAAAELLSRGTGTVFVAADPQNAEQRSATAILGLWDERIRLTASDVDALQDLPGADRVVVRGPCTEITSAHLSALAAAAQHAPVEPLRLADDGTIASAGTALLDGRIVPLLAGHPAEDARALGSRIASAGPAGGTFASPLPLSSEAAWTTLLTTEAVAPERDKSPVPAVPAGPDARDLLRPLGWSTEGYGQSLRFVRSHRSVTLPDGSVVPSLRWAIKTSAPSGRRGESWGETHFARGLAAALRRLGQEVVIDAYAARARPSRYLDDVSLALRGPFRIDAEPDALSLLWIISHPDEIASEELFGFDEVFAASEPWARKATVQFGREIRPLLQCTDISRFHPTGASRGDDLVFVGTARGIARPSVVEPIRAGVPVHVYGPDWTGYIPASHVVAPGIANDDLPLLYETAGAVLNDHWPAMRVEGFISNRLFDVVAAGGRAISDDVDGITDLFGGAVRTYADVTELLSIVTGDLSAAFPGADALSAVGRRIRAEHSFDARAATLLNVALAALGRDRA